MPVVRFTKALARHVDCPEDEVDGSTVREALDAYFAAHPGVQHYVLDEQGDLRRHITVFVGGSQLRDRTGMTDPTDDGAEVYVLQALSGG